MTPVSLTNMAAVPARRQTTKCLGRAVPATSDKCRLVSNELQQDKIRLVLLDCVLEASWNQVGIYVLFQYSYVVLHNRSIRHNDNNNNIVS